VTRMGIIDYENFLAGVHEIDDLYDYARGLRRPEFINPYMKPWEIVRESDRMVSLAIEKSAPIPPEGEHLSMSWSWKMVKDKKPKKPKAVVA
jgi:hypothetical protein